MRKPEPRDILVVELPHHRPPGHEQEGYRPALVVGLPERLGPPRYPLLAVVPLTTQIGPWADRSPDLYPRFAAGTAGLPHDSAALLEHVRGVDLQRVRRYVGTLTKAEYTPIREGLRRMFDLPKAAAGAEGSEGEPSDTEEGASDPETDLSA